MEQLDARAKRPASALLAGPYGHPFHPILVTVPIGAWICALVFDIATKVKHGGSQHLAYGSYWLIGIGIIGALVAALFGLLDLLALPRRTPALRVGLTHMVLNLAVVAAFVGSFIWRADRGAQLPTTNGMFVLSAIALAVAAELGVGGAPRPASTPVPPFQSPPCGRG